MSKHGQMSNLPVPINRPYGARMTGTGLSEVRPVSVWLGAEALNKETPKIRREVRGCQPPMGELDLDSASHT
jgi:hypothetical protein